MPVEGGRSSSFLTASATVPVSWLELGHVSSHRPSPPACETPYAALVRDHASTPAPPKGSASCTRRPSIESAAVKSALRGEHGRAQPVAVVADGVEVAAIRIAQRRQDEIVGVLYRSLLPASGIRFRPSRPLLAASAGCGSKRRPTGHGTGRSHSGIPAPHRQRRDCAWARPTASGFRPARSSKVTGWLRGLLSTARLQAFTFAYA